MPMVLNIGMLACSHLILHAFILKQCCAKVQSHRAASMAADTYFFKARQLRRPWRLLFLTEAPQTSETYQWNTQTNGNWGMETKGPCRSLWHVISEGEGVDLFHLTFTSPTENVTECQPLPLDIMVLLTAQSYWSQKKTFVHFAPSLVLPVHCPEKDRHSCCFQISLPSQIFLCFWSLHALAAFAQWEEILLLDLDPSRELFLYNDIFTVGIL